MYIIGAHHPLLGLLDLVALPPVSSLQLKVGHPAQGQGCHQGGNQGRHQYGHKVLQDLTENCKPGRILPVVRLDVLLVVHGAHVHVVRCDDHLLEGKVIVTVGVRMIIFIAIMIMILSLYLVAAEF